MGVSGVLLLLLVVPLLLALSVLLLSKIRNRVFGPWPSERSYTSIVNIYGGFGLASTADPPIRALTRTLCQWSVLGCCTW